MGLPSGEQLAGSQWLTAVDATTRKATSAVAVVLGPMTVGQVYFLRSDSDAFFLQGTSSVAPTTTTGNPIFAKEGVRVFCDDATANGYVGVILATSTGVAWLSKVT